MKYIVKMPMSDMYGLGLAQGAMEALCNHFGFAFESCEIMRDDEDVFDAGVSLEHLSQARALIVALWRTWDHECIHYKVRE